LLYFFSCFYRPNINTRTVIIKNNEFNQIDKTDEKISETVEQLAQQCLNIDIKLAVAESCTGGWLAKSITDLAGSSGWFDRGFVTYSNEAKNSMISVQNTTLESYGAVSEQVVSEMAQGVLIHSNASLSVAISGIAARAVAQNKSRLA